MTYLIINADDYGWTERVNSAVLRAHREGILTSASLMVAEEGSEQAVRLAKETPSLGVGLHVATTFDRALLPPSEIPHLVGPNGKFESNPLRAGLKYAFSSSAQRELKREMEAQFARFSETGLPWSHVDGHQHFHMHPTVFRYLLELCDRVGANRLRVPRESLQAHLRGGGDGLTPIAIGALILQLLCRLNMKRLLKKGTLGGKPIFVCDQVYGDYQTSNMHTNYTLNLLERVEGKAAEIYYHPGTDYATKLPLASQTESVRDVELQALLSLEVRKRAQEKGYPLVTYAEAEAGVRSEQTTPGRHSHEATGP